MCFPPLPDRRVGVDRRAGKWMSKLDRARAQRDQARALHGRQRGEVDPEPICGALEHRQIAAVAGGGEHQRAAGRLVENPYPPHERARDSCGYKHRGTFGSECEFVCVRRELKQRQRVAGRRAVQLMGGGRRNPAQQQLRLVDGQATDSERRQVGSVEQRRLAITNRDQNRNRIGHQPAEGE